MEAKDLMQFDWVLLGKKKLRCKGVSGHTNDVFLEDGTLTNVMNLSPIPLTPEILEKNGFYWGYTATEEDFCGAVGCGYPDKGWCFDEGAGEIKILFPNERDGGLVRLDDQSGDRHLELVFAKPLMVHELQHALRLCGIEKEIIV